VINFDDLVFSFDGRNYSIDEQVYFEYDCGIVKINQMFYCFNKIKDKKCVMIGQMISSKRGLGTKTLEKLKTIFDFIDPGEIATKDGLYFAYKAINMGLFDIKFKDLIVVKEWKELHKYLLNNILLDLKGNPNDPKNP